MANLKSSKTLSSYLYLTLTICVDIIPCRNMIPCIKLCEVLPYIRLYQFLFRSKSYTNYKRKLYSFNTNDNYEDNFG